MSCVCAAVRAAQADAGLPGDPQGPAGEQRPAPAAAAPPHRQDKHRLLQGAGERRMHSMHTLAKRHTTCHLGPCPVPLLLKGSGQVSLGDGGNE